MCVCIIRTTMVRVTVIEASHDGMSFNKAANALIGLCHDVMNYDCKIGTALLV